MKSKHLMFPLFFILLLLGACTETDPVPDTRDEPTETKDQAQAHHPNYQTQIDEEYLETMDEIHNDLMQVLHTDTYTLSEPFVEVNPYGTAPLTALVAFETEEAARSEVIIHGKTPATTFTQIFDEFTTQHSVPVLGLYAGTENTVEINVYNKEGLMIDTTHLSIATDPLPDDFWDLELAVETDAETTEPGLTFLIPSRGNLLAVDTLGDVRYIIEPWMANTFNQLENGHIVLALRKEEDGNYNQLVEMNRLGKVEQAILLDIDNYDRVNYFHHDMIEAPDGNWLVTIHDGSGEHIEDEMALLDRKTGEVLWNMNFRDLFPSEFYTDYTGPVDQLGDWFHQNAVWLTEDEDSILVSSRHQDAVIKLSYPDNEFEWILAADEDWPEEFKEYLLEPIGEVKFPGAQHAVMELPDQDDDPDTMDILLFDNNRVITRGNREMEDQFSRGVQYRINEVEHTVEEIWSYGEERGIDFFSRIVGDADLLPMTENVLLTSGRIEVDEEHPQSRIVEVDPANDNEIIFEIIVSRFADEDGDRRQIYRAERLPLYPRFGHK